MNFADEIVGNFYSKEYVRKRILKQTQEEIDEIDRQIAAEGGGEEEIFPRSRAGIQTLFIGGRKVP